MLVGERAGEGRQPGRDGIGRRVLAAGGRHDNPQLVRTRAETLDAVGQRQAFLAEVASILAPRPPPRRR